MRGARDNAERHRVTSSKLAVTSVSLAVLGIFVLVLRITLYRPWWSEFVGRNITGFSGITGLILAMVAFARTSRRMAVITVLVVLSPFLLFYSSILIHSRLLLVWSSYAFYASLACLVGLLLGVGALRWMSRSARQFKGTALPILGIVLTTFLLDFWWAETCGPMSSAAGMACGANLTKLGKVMSSYANQHQRDYPDPNRWCDLLLNDADAAMEHFLCPGVKLQWRRQVLPWPVPKRGKCYYAMNPNCRLDSPPDMVLLFESKSGWNQSGGAELLSSDNHKRQGCNVLFVDGSVRFVKPDEVVGLKWADERELPEDVRNARRPANDAELRYWVQNMVWYHRFATEEVRLATGLTEREIRAAQEWFDLWPGNRPKRDADAPLLVLPYPGGRHPRIGFLEGAIDPQRETKFSVFTPWNPNSYVVVDVPEAIWSNLGLTYLAHTHIDTIWTKQGIELAKLEWNRRADGSLDIERTLPNGIAFGVKAVPDKEAVRMEMWLRNGTDERLTDLRVQICVMTKMAAGFAGQTNENKVFTNPYVACRSANGQRWIITAWENCDRPWGNEQCPCFHSDPKFPDLEPGRQARLRGWLSFYEGPDIQAEFARFEASGWRQN